MIDTIADPLRDRMEMIDVSGYVAEEKIAIAQVSYPRVIDVWQFCRHLHIALCKFALSVH